MTHNLLPHLVHAYGGPGHERIRSMAGRTIVRIDDFKRGDAPLRFCHISATFEGEDERCTLNLLNAPVNDEVEDLVRKHGGRIINAAGRNKNICLSIGAADAGLVRDVADAIWQAIAVTPEQPRWKDRNWIWKCPRTAASLDRFAGHLEDFHQAARKRFPATTVAPAASAALDIQFIGNCPMDSREPECSL